MEPNRAGKHWQGVGGQRSVSSIENDPRMQIMANDGPPPPFVYDGLDPVLEEKTVVGEVTDAVKGTARRIGGAIDSGRRPGMPLSVLSNIAREAPLGRSWSRSCWASRSQGAGDRRGIHAKND
jgi:hypothetical protein